MATESFQKELCEYLYCYQRKTVDEILNLTDVSKSTLYRWIDKEGWNRGALSKELSSLELANNLRWHINETQKKAREENRPMNNKEIDAITKLMSLVSRLNPQIVFVSHAITAMDMFSSFLKVRKPEIHATVAEFMMLFLQDLAKTYSD